jgi:hypothetical protein
MKISLMLLGLTILWSCGTTTVKIPASKDTHRSPAVTEYDESFDPLTLKDDDITDELKKSAPLADPENKIDGKVEIKSVLSPATVQGYRVQIIATRDIESATLTRQKAEEQFSTTDHKSYLIYEAPQFKIRLGDAATREEAEEIRNLAREYGYRGAFIVRSEVTVRENKQ